MRTGFTWSRVGTKQHCSINSLSLKHQSQGEKLFAYSCWRSSYLLHPACRWSRKNCSLPRFRTNCKCSIQDYQFWRSVICCGQNPSERQKMSQIRSRVSSWGDLGKFWGGRSWAWPLTLGFFLSLSLCSLSSYYLGGELHLDTIFRYRKVTVADSQGPEPDSVKDFWYIAFTYTFKKVVYFLKSYH